MEEVTIAELQYQLKAQQRLLEVAELYREQEWRVWEEAEQYQREAEQH